MRTSCVTARGAQDGSSLDAETSGQQDVPGTTIIILTAWEVDYVIPITQKRKLRLRGHTAAGSSLRPEPPKPIAVSPFQMCPHSICAPAAEEEASGGEMGALLRRILEI